MRHMKSQEIDIPAIERWRQYEAEKQVWTSFNPGATAQEYEAAMQAIAQRCGV